MYGFMCPLPVRLLLIKLTVIYKYMADKNALNIVCYGIFLGLRFVDALSCCLMTALFLVKLAAIRQFARNT
jgi:hypothetical protein